MASTKPASDKPAHAGASDSTTVKIVFICAAGHSGSTLLNRLLGAHPDGLAVGEITQFPKNLALDSTCSCGEALSRCEFWRPFVVHYGQQLGVDLWRRPYQLNLGPIMAGHEIDPRHQTRVRMGIRKMMFASEYARLAFGLPVVPGARAALARCARQKVDFLSNLARYADSAFVIDSSKHYLDALHLYLADPARVRIIMLSRDGRAVYASGLRRGLESGAAIAAWQRPNERALNVIPRQVPETARTDVRYEDLASDPVTVLRRLTEFVDIGFDESMLDFGQDRSHIANGNRMRLGQSSDIRLDEAWRRQLDPEQLARFDRVAGALNRRLGYGT